MGMRSEYAERARALKRTWWCVSAKPFEVGKCGHPSPWWCVGMKQVAWVSERAHERALVCVYMDRIRKQATHRSTCGSVYRRVGGGHGGTGGWVIIEAWKPSIQYVGLVLLVVCVALHDLDHE